MTATELRPRIDRMLAKVKPGAKMPVNVTDKSFLEILDAMLDVLIPEDPDNDPVAGIPILPGGRDRAEMSVSMRGRRKPVSKADIAQAKLDLAARLPGPRRK